LSADVGQLLGRWGLNDDQPLLVAAALPCCRRGRAQRVVVDRQQVARYGQRKAVATAPVTPGAVGTDDMAVAIPDLPAV
jgi:hypothetical protein